MGLKDYLNKKLRAVVRREENDAPHHAPSEDNVHVLQDPEAIERRIDQLDPRLTVVNWPIKFFGKNLYPIWRLDINQFIGPTRIFPAENNMTSETIKQWALKSPINIEPILNFRHNAIILQDYSIGRIEDTVYLLNNGQIIGAYEKRSLIIMPEERRKNLSCILILAKATLLNGPPNPDRASTVAGRRSLISAYIWACYNQKQRSND